MHSNDDEDVNNPDGAALLEPAVMAPGAISSANVATLVENKRTSDGNLRRDTMQQTLRYAWKPLAHLAALSRVQTWIRARGWPSWLGWWSCGR